MQIIRGRQGTGKTTEMFKRINRLAGKADIYIVVPEQYTFSAEEAVFSSLGVEAVSRVNVVSLNRLARNVIAESGGRALRLLSDEGKALIVKYVIARNEKALRVFSQVASRKGFADDVSDLLSEIKRNALSFDDIGGAEAAASNKRLKDKLDDFKPIYDDYTRILGEQYIDKDDFLTYASGFVADSALVKNAYFFFDDFFTFDSSAYGFITALVSAAADCVFTLTCGEGDFFALTQETEKALENCAELAAKKLETTVLTGKKDSPEDIVYLESAITELCPDAYPKKSENIHSFAAGDIYEEARYVASRIKKLVRENGLRYGDIAVTVADTQKYSPVLSDAFASAEIPFFMDVRRKIIFSSPVKAFLFLTDLAREYTSADILAFLKTGFGPLDDAQINVLQNYIDEFGIKGNMWLRPFTRNNLWQTYDLDEVNRLRELTIKPISEFAASVSKTSAVGEYVQTLYSCLTLFGFPEKIRLLCENFKKSADYETANTYAQLYNKLISVLTQLDEFLGAEKLDRASIHDMLSYALGVCEVGVIPSNLDSVSVGDVVRSRAAGVKAMFVMGANEGMLPQTVKPGGILTDGDKQALAKDGLKLIDTADYKREKENFILYTLLSKPRSALYISRFSADGSEKGNKFEAALVFEKITSMFEGCEERTDAYDAITAPESAFSAMSLNKALRAKSRKQKPSREDTVYDAVYDCFKNDKRYAYYADMADTALEFKNEAVIKERAVYDEALKSQRVMSASRLEKYAACPFSFFAQYLLRAREHAESKPDILDTGNVLHEIMQKYSELIINGDIDPKTAEAKLISDTVEELCRSVTESYRGGKYKAASLSDYLRVKLSRTAQTAAVEITEQLKNSSFLIEEAEAEFNFSKKYVPVCVETSSGDKVYIQGKIDRVDTCTLGGKKYARIIDYKTGSRTLDLTRLYFGLSLQLPLYIRAYSASHEETQTGGVFYLSLKPPLTDVKTEAGLDKVKSALKKYFKHVGIALSDINVIEAMDSGAQDDCIIDGVNIKNGEIEESKSLTDKEGFDILWKTTEKNIADIYGSIKKAEIPITPSRLAGASKSETGCKYCSYSGICKFSEEFPANSYKLIPKIEGTDIKKAFSETDKERN